MHTKTQCRFINANRSHFISCRFELDDEMYVDYTYGNRNKLKTYLIAQFYQASDHLDPADRIVWFEEKRRIKS